MPRAAKKKAKKAPNACSFCWTPERADFELMYQHATKGPWICRDCVWRAVELINEEIEDHRCVVYVATSQIHERGVFSGQYIRKGTYVGTYSGHDDGPITRRNQRYVMYSYHTVTGEEDGWRTGTNEFRFLNHSDDPNLEMDGEFHFWARRNIKKDEELTWYYGTEFSEVMAKKKAKAKRRRG